MTVATVAELEKKIAKHGITNAELCRRAGIAVTTLGRWKNGEYGPNMRTWEKVVAALNEIITEKDAETAK